MTQDKNHRHCGSIDNVLETLEGNDSADSLGDFGPVVDANR